MFDKTPPSYSNLQELSCYQFANLINLGAGPQSATLADGRKISYPPGFTLISPETASVETGITIEQEATGLRFTFVPAKVVSYYGDTITNYDTNYSPTVLRITYQITLSDEDSRGYFL